MCTDTFLNGGAGNVSAGDAAFFGGGALAGQMVNFYSQTALAFPHAPPPAEQRLLPLMNSGGGGLAVVTSSTNDNAVMHQGKVSGDGDSAPPTNTQFSNIDSEWHLMSM
jgi:hypothetical protein